MALSGKYDAIVVGARCAGSPAALRLARKGHKVLLVDRDQFPSAPCRPTGSIHQQPPRCSDGGCSIG